MNGKKLMQSWFATLDKIGVCDDGSTMRLGYTATEDAMIKATIAMGESLGLTHHTDTVGNTFIYNGSGQGEYTVIGSHLDSVIHGGKFDGVVGVLGGLLVLHWIEKNKLNIPVKVAIFRMEESSTFGAATVGSKLITGKMDENALKKAKNADGLTLYDALLQSGYSVTPPLIKNIKQYLELHIEQGRVLEAEELPLGVVNSIAAPVRLWVTFTGRQDHSGATPMGLRKDALVGAAEYIVNINAFAQQETHEASVATVGIIRNTPNAFNVIPGEVTLGLDIRGIIEESRERIVQNALINANTIAEKHELTCTTTLISRSNPVKLDTTVQNNLAKVAKKLNIPHIIMPSGAGHDAMNFADICPVGMLFIPCKEGISHNKDEFASIDDMVLACKVLFEYLQQ